jgi:hypothetical protein
LMMYFAVIVTVPSLLLVSLRSAPLIRGLLNLASSRSVSHDTRRHVHAAKYGAPSRDRLACVKGETVANTFKWTHYQKKRLGGFFPSSLSAAFSVSHAGRQASGHGGAALQTG